MNQQNENSAVTFPSVASNGYWKGYEKPPVVRKTVIYKCGCRVILENWGQKETGLFCQTHHEAISRIITEESFQP